MTEPILQHDIPDPPWLDQKLWRLPGVQPLPVKQWLIRDDVFAGQMSLRDKLIAERPSEVYALLDDAQPAAKECYDTVLGVLQNDPGYRVEAELVVRPDKVIVPLDPEAPLLTLGRLIQEDLCLMERRHDAHVLTGAVLCFPAYWTLAQKIGRPLDCIHGPVPEYDEIIAARVQRMFDAMRPEQPLWRMNANLHASAKLFAPKDEGRPDSRVGVEQGTFVRSERQVLRKLPSTDAIVFSIHTYLVRASDLSHEAQSKLYRLAQ